MFEWKDCGLDVATTDMMLLRQTWGDILDSVFLQLAFNHV